MNAPADGDRPIRQLWQRQFYAHAIMGNTAEGEAVDGGAAYEVAWTFTVPNADFTGSIIVGSASTVLHESVGQSAMSEMLDEPALLEVFLEDGGEDFLHTLVPDRGSLFIIRDIAVINGGTDTILAYALQAILNSFISRNAHTTVIAPTNWPSHAARAAHAAAGGALHPAPGGNVFYRRSDTIPHQDVFPD